MTVIFLRELILRSGGRITFPPPYRLSLEIFQGNAELSISIPEALENAEVGTHLHGLR